MRCIPTEYFCKIANYQQKNMLVDPTQTHTHESHIAWNVCLLFTLECSSLAGAWQAHISYQNRFFEGKKPTNVPSQAKNAVCLCS